MWVPVHGAHPPLREQCWVEPADGGASPWPSPLKPRIPGRPGKEHRGQGRGDRTRGTWARCRITYLAPPLVWAPVVSPSAPGGPLSAAGPTSVFPAGENRTGRITQARGPTLTRGMCQTHHDGQRLPPPLGRAPWAHLGVRAEGGEASQDPGGKGRAPSPFSLKTD